MPEKSVDTRNASKVDLKVYAGNNIELELTFVHQDQTPVVFNGSLRMEVRLNFLTAPAMFLVEGDGLTVLSNVVTIIKPVNIKGGIYQYDLSEVDSDGSLRTWIYGDFIVTQNITNPRV